MKSLILIGLSMFLYGFTWTVEVVDIKSKEKKTYQPQDKKFFLPGINCGLASTYNSKKGKKDLRNITCAYRTKDEIEIGLVCPVFLRFFYQEKDIVVKCVK